MEIIRKASITTLANSGVQSEQLLFPENFSSRRITITKGTVQPRAVNPTHRHPASEQVWVAI
jgi:quercetin dioxygenase-like cupin family protein